MEPDLRAGAVCRRRTRTCAIALGTQLDWRFIEVSIAFKSRKTSRCGAQSRWPVRLLLELARPATVTCSAHRSLARHLNCRRCAPGRYPSAHAESRRVLLCTAFGRSLPWPPDQSSRLLHRLRPRGRMQVCTDAAPSCLRASEEHQRRGLSPTASKAAITCERARCEGHGSGLARTCPWACLRREAACVAMHACAAVRSRVQHVGSAPSYADVRLAQISSRVDCIGHVLLFGRISHLASRCHARILFGAHFHSCMFSCDHPANSLFVGIFETEHMRVGNVTIICGEWRTFWRNVNDRTCVVISSRAVIAKSSRAQSLMP